MRREGPKFGIFKRYPGNDHAQSIKTTTGAENLQGTRFGGVFILFLINASAYPTRGRAKVAYDR